MKNVDLLGKISFVFEKYKSIKDPITFDRIKRLNVIIGKNNIGKSALLDLLQVTFLGETRMGHSIHEDVKKSDPDAKISIKINMDDELLEYFLNQLFESRKGSTTFSGSIKEIGPEYFTYEIAFPSGGINFHKEINSSGPHTTQMVDHFDKRLSTYKFQRLNADRDISKEKSKDNYYLQPNGEGATNLIRRFLHESSVDRHKMIENDLVTGFNTIFKPDFEIKNITVTYNGEIGNSHQDEPEYEVQLVVNDSKDRIPLSRTGSGIKTVLLVLLNLLIIPRFEEKPVSSYIFGFEEIENNLHPTLQRRLLKYLDDFSKKNGCKIFFTTHSPIFLDYLSTEVDGQIIHVNKDSADEHVKVKLIENLPEKFGILEDLGCKASDILQANCIIWLEGPSDRIYFNKWIELWSNCELKEGLHYQCIFTSGTLLTYFSNNIDELTETEFKDRIKMFQINRNGIILIDSDKHSEEAELKSRVQKIEEEFAAMKAICWITKGREVENYR